MEEKGIDETWARVRKSIKVLEHNKNEERRQRDKHNDRVTILLMSINLLLIIVGILSSAWTSVLVVLGYSLFFGVVWVQERRISDMQYVIDMQDGLHKIESDEITAASFKSPMKKQEFASKSEERRVKASREKK